MPSGHRYKLQSWIHKFIKNNVPVPPSKPIPTKPIHDLVYEAAKNLTVITLSKPLKYDDESNTFTAYIPEMYNISSSSIEGIEYSSYSYDKSNGILKIDPTSEFDETSSEPIILSLYYDNGPLQPIKIVILLYTQ